MSIDSILEEIAVERRAQDLKGGMQNHPSLDPVLLHRDGSCTPQRMAEEYEIPSESRANQLINLAAGKGELTWGHIATEEFAEVIACLKNEKDMRAELVQLAAVCVAWIECLDRRALDGAA